MMRKLFEDLAPGRRIVVAACIKEHGKVLLAKRAPWVSVAANQYHLPGGHLLDGEDPEEGLRRELKEELGVDVTVGMPLHVFCYLDSDRREVLAIVFLASLSTRTCPTCVAQENVELEWVARRGLQRYFATTTDPNLVAAKKALSLTPK